MIRLYRQTPEGIERTTQVDAAEQHLDSVFWIDLLTPEPAEIKFVERLCGLEMPTYDEMREIEATSRLYTEDGARFMTTTVLSRVDTESPLSVSYTHLDVYKRQCIHYLHHEYHSRSS